MQVGIITEETDSLGFQDALESLSAEQVRQMDWERPGATTWLIKHLHWAMANGRAVILVPAPPQPSTGAVR